MPSSLFLSMLEASRRWIARIDRERAASFSRFLLKRFIDDRCFESASALAYTTLFALVPFSAVVFAVLSAFPAFDAWTGALTDFLFSRFVPSSARDVEHYLRSFATNARQLTGPGVLALLASVLLTMWSIEQAFNRIWRVASPRPRLTRFLLYWTLLTLGSLAMVAALATASALFSIPALSIVKSHGWAGSLLRFLPLVLQLVFFTLAYVLIPHRRVPFRFALAGGALAAILFEWLKWGLAIYLRNASFEQLYGALATLPILLVWVYTSWLVVLLGASVAASLSAFRYQPRALRLGPGMELYGVLRLLGRFEQAREHGASLYLERMQELEPSLTDDLLQRMLTALSALNIVRLGEDGGWLLARDLDAVSLGEIYEGMGLRVSFTESPLPLSHDDLGRAAALALNHLRQPLHAPLRQSVGSFLDSSFLNSSLLNSKQAPEK